MNEIYVIPISHERHIIKHVDFYLLLKFEGLDIIAKDTNDRGSSFEFLMTSLLDSMGYTDIKSRVRKTGMEIDIKAKHKVIRNNIICECKAAQRRIDAKDLQYFFGKLKHQRSKDRRLRGFFFSVSGFSGTANEWYDELSVAEKRNFEIFGQEKLVDLLLQNDMVIGEKRLYQILEKNNTVNLQLGMKYIVLFRSMLFIVQLFNLENSPYRYMILTSKGEIASKTMTKMIKGLHPLLKKLCPIDVLIVDKVLLNLLDVKSKTISEISSEIVEAFEDTNFAVQELKEMGVICQVQSGTEPRYKVNTGIDDFYKIAERFLSSRFRYDLLSSPYIEIVINDLFLDEIQDRFKLNLSKHEQNIVLKILKYFPSALDLILFKDTTEYRNRFDQLKQSPQFESRKNSMYIENLQSLLSELVRLVIVDLDSIPSRFIEGKKIAGYLLTTDLRIALSDMPLFKILSSGTVMFTRAARPIKPGQYVMYADEDTPLYFALVIYFLEDFNKAINEYNKIIEGTTNSNKLKAAWNNMGLCYEALDNNKKALQCYDRAIACDPDLIQAQQNKKRLLQMKDKDYSGLPNK